MSHCLHDISGPFPLAPQQKEVPQDVKSYRPYFPYLGNDHTQGDPGCYCFDSARKLQAVAEDLSIAFKQILVGIMPFRRASLTPLLVTVPFAATLLVGADLREVAEVRVLARSFGHIRSTVLVGPSAGIAGLLLAGALAGQVGAIVVEHVAAVPRKIGTCPQCISDDFAMNHGGLPPLPGLMSDFS